MRKRLLRNSSSPGRRPRPRNSCCQTLSRAVAGATLRPERSVQHTLSRVCCGSCASADGKCRWGGRARALVIWGDGDSPVQTVSRRGSAVAIATHGVVRGAHQEGDGAAVASRSSAGATADGRSVVRERASLGGRLLMLGCRKARVDWGNGDYLVVGRACVGCGNDCFGGG